MDEPTIKCPECGTSIKLTESLAGPLLESKKQDFEKKLKAKDDLIAEKVAKLEKEQNDVLEARRNLDSEILKAVSSEKKKISLEEKEKAKRLVELDLKKIADEKQGLEKALKRRETQLEDAHKNELELIQKQRLFEEEKRQIDLTVEKKIAQATKDLRAKFQAEADASLDLKLKEKEMTISAMQKQIEGLKRRAEQGSQQSQGEVLELELEQTLKSKFVFDKITPVAKGVKGGDVIQTVMSPIGVFCGKILWETKRTKAWSGSWISKVKEDQRNAQADIAVIMTATLPSEIVRFGQLNGVWVTDFQSALSLVEALRITLIQVANSKATQDGQETKMELVYEYLTGPKFKHRIEAVVEKFDDMREDLNREKKVMVKNWAKRESQIEGVVMATLGMYGDLEGIAGTSMPEIEGMDPPLLENDEWE